MSLCYRESNIFLLHVLGKEHKHRAVNCIMSAQTVLEKVFWPELFLIHVLCVCLYPLSPTLSTASTEVGYLGSVGFTLVLPPGTGLVVS